MTTSRGWIALAASIAAVVGFLVWAVFGSIPDRVAVGAVLTRSGAFTEVFAPVSGSVAAVEVEPGDTVGAGTILATISTADGSSAHVTAPVPGVVQEVAVTAGEPVAAGAEVATVVDESSDAPLRAITYVGPIDAEALRGIDEVTVEPATVDAAEHGTLVGRVAFVADVSASTASMVRQLNSESLATTFAAAAGDVPYLVVVEFDDPPQWRGGDPPPFDVVDGTLAELSAIVDRQRPIELVF